MKKNLGLFWTFFKIGIITFGGGMAMMPLLQKEAVNKKKWVTDEEIIDYFAISQSIPGSIAANVATIIGHKVNKFWGGVFSLLGMVTPSIIVITLIASFLSSNSDLIIIQKALKGINIAVLVMLIGIMISMRKNLRDIFCVILAILAFVLISFFKVNPSIIIIGSAIIGAIIYQKKVKA